ncbi:MAG: hypothetical protein ACP5OO_10905 [Chloroflexia bacterium]
MESTREYELKTFFTYVIEVLERLDIPYGVLDQLDVVIEAVRREMGPNSPISW